MKADSQMHRSSLVSNSALIANIVETKAVLLETNASAWFNIDETINFYSEMKTELNIS